MKIVETLFPVAFVIALVINYLQGYYNAKRRAKTRPDSIRNVAPMSTGLLGQDSGDGEGLIGPIPDQYLTGEIPRDWLDTAMPRPAREWVDQSIDEPGDRRFFDSSDSSQGGYLEDHHLMNDFGLINPATGLPMLNDGPVDIAGNAFGEDGSQHEWGSSSHDSWNSDSLNSSSSTSSWDDNR